jgi:protein gp37
MADRSHIEWTQATWNPTTGCTRVSAGCDHCYIERTPPFRIAGRRFDGSGVGASTGVLLHADRLSLPLRWRKPRKVFVNSLSDLFHADVPDEFIARVFAVMALAPQHTFQLLTKRHARMRSLLSSRPFADLFNRAICDSFDFLDSGVRLPVSAIDGAQALIGDRSLSPLPNVWLGVSVEDQHWADIRIPALLNTPAAVRWISAEPLLGPLKLGRYVWSEPSGLPGDWTRGLDWVVVGGESGPGARPMRWQWARDLRDTCAAAKVPFLFKQAGSVFASKGKGGDPLSWPEPMPREYPV